MSQILSAPLELKAKKHFHSRIEIFNGKIILRRFHACFKSQINLGFNCGGDIKRFK